MNKMDEMIVVCPRTSIFGTTDAYSFTGLLTDEYYKDLLKAMATSTQLMRRGNAENDINYKQPIPYVVLTRQINNKIEVFMYKRLSGGGESRLHDKLSIGIGGHMNSLFNAMNLPYYISNDAARELHEELNIDHTPTFNIIGLINDDSNDVGKVHIGILIRSYISKDALVTVKETDQLQGDWISLDDIHSPNIYNKLEDWSKLAIEALME